MYLPYSWIGKQLVESKVLEENNVLQSDWIIIVESESPTEGGIIRFTK